jgi:methylase of polypeptide subunit release factors
MTKEEVLQQCTVEGNVVKLPAGQLGRKLYQEVAKALELIGGKWEGRKVCGFVFPEDPTELLEQIANGEKRNLKKEFQFFGTPDALADQLVKAANIQAGNKVLEPSAGQGAIVKAINRTGVEEVFCYELMPVNQTILKKMTTVNFLGDDFLNPNGTGHLKFDRIIANPPFSKNQDIDHVREMYKRLAPGGRLVSITSEHWNMSNNRKETDFQAWLDELDAGIFPIEKGAFKESGTAVGGVIVIIDKN